MIRVSRTKSIGWKITASITVVALCFAAMAAYLAIKSNNSTLEAKQRETGKHIYLTGRMSSGEAIQAIVGNDTQVNGNQFSCVNCHRRSRLGSSEGGKQVPPLTANALFNPAQMPVTKGVLPRAFKYSRSARLPYTDASLGKSDTAKESIRPDAN